MKGQNLGLLPYHTQNYSLHRGKYLISVVTNSETRSRYKQYLQHRPVFGLYEIKLRNVYLAKLRVKAIDTQTHTHHTHTHTHTHIYMCVCLGLLFYVFLLLLERVWVFFFVFI